jgi:hypothetical protein
MAAVLIIHQGNDTGLNCSALKNVKTKKGDQRPPFHL